MSVEDSTEAASTALIGRGRERNGGREGDEEATFVNKTDFMIRVMGPAAWGIDSLITFFTVVPLVYGIDR